MALQAEVLPAVPPAMPHAADHPVGQDQPPLGLPSGATGAAVASRGGTSKATSPETPTIAAKALRPISTPPAPLELTNHDERRSGNPAHREMVGPKGAPAGGRGEHLEAQHP